MPQAYSPKAYQQLSHENWDAIVVGSGLGGLTAANLMARAGKKVLILERHTVPGGFTHTFTRKGFEWDVGVHYVGRVANPNGILRRIFDYVGEGNIAWAPMDPLYDVAVIEGDRYEFVSGVENQIQKLVALFPSEERAIRKYYKLVQRVSTGSAWFFGEKMMPPGVSFCIGWPLRWYFEKYSRLTTYEVLRSLTDNERLISVLCAQCGDYGLTPKRSSFGIHAMVVDHYLEGGSYPSGGSRRINEAILDSAERHGAKLLLKADVDQILVEGGRAVGVRMKNGDCWRAKSIVSNAGARNTFQRLLPETFPLPPRVSACFESVEPSSAHVCLYVGVDGSDEELSLPKHNYWLYDQYDFDAAFALHQQAPETSPTLTYISFPSAKDPEWPARRPGRATIQVMGAFPYQFVKEWEDEPWMKRGEAYQALKERVTERMLGKLYEVLPQLQGRVVYHELSTPLSTRHFMHYKNGEIYGLEHTPNRFRQRWLRSHSPVKQLFLTGQDVISVGVGGALFSGVVAATAVLGRPVVFNIFMNRPLSAPTRPG